MLLPTLLLRLLPPPPAAQLPAACLPRPLLLQPPSTAHSKFCHPRTRAACPAASGRHPCTQQAHRKLPLARCTPHLNHTWKYSSLLHTLWQRLPLASPHTNTWAPSRGSPLQSCHPAGHTSRHSALPPQQPPNPAAPAPQGAGGRVRGRKQEGRQCGSMLQFKGRAAAASCATSSS